MLSMNIINKIRKNSRSKKLTINKIAGEYNISWSTAKKYTEIPTEKLEKTSKRKKIPSVATPEVIAEIDKYLHDEINRNVPRKQRYTARYIFHSMTKNQIYHGSERQFREIIKYRREEFNCNVKSKKSYLELDFKLGEYIQIDHGETLVSIDGFKITAFLFVATIPGTSIRYCQLTPIKSSEAWGYFFEKMEIFFGAIPVKSIVDNDSVLKNGKTKSITNFASNIEVYYDTEFVFCNPASGNEKGAVEGSVGYCRRNYLPGIYSFATFEECNNYLNDKCNQDLLTRNYYKDGRSLTIIFEDFKKIINEKQLQVKNNLTKPIGIKTEELVVDKFQCISFNGYRYSVPEKYIGAKLKVIIELYKISIYDSNYIESNLIYQHCRLHYGNVDGLKLEHFIDQLVRKTNAIDFAKAVQQSNIGRKILEIKKRLENQFEANESKLEVIKILKLIKKYPEDVLIKSFDLALELSIITTSAIDSIICHTLSSNIPILIPTDNLIKDCQINIDNYYDLNLYNDLTIGGNHVH